MQTDPKDNNAEFDARLQGLNRPSVHQALGKSVVSKQSHCDLQSVDLLEETSLQDREVCII